MGKRLKILINITVLLLIVSFVWYMVSSLNEEEHKIAETHMETEPFTSPLKRTSYFNLPEEINCFELNDDNLFISAGQSVYIYDYKGQCLSSFMVKPDLRDINVMGENIYILYPTYIEVYSMDGNLINNWAACSELSDYCSFTITNNNVFVSDAENKNICKYTIEGNFVKFIKSPQGFIIPSYSFDIENYNDTIYCVNSGRHLIETYTQDGKFIASFGGPGSKAGFFAGCCNPAYLSFTSEGMLITSEKGNPRISSFERNGKFKELLLNSKLLGGGSKAYEVKIRNDLFFISGKNSVSIFRYNTTEI